MSILSHIARRLAAALAAIGDAIRDRLTASATAHLDDRLRDDIGLRPRTPRAVPSASVLATTAWR